MITVVDRYGEAIEADFHHEYQLDLLDFFRGVFSRRKLYRLIEQLPGSSRYAAARADDDEVAKAALEHEAVHGRKPGRPRLVDWDGKTDLLSLIADRLGLLIAIQTSGKAPFEPLQRPVTARERVEHRATLTKHNALVAEVKAAQARNGG